MTLPHYVAAVVEYTTSVLWAKEELLQSNTEHSRPATTEDLCKFFFLPSFLHNSAAKEIVACLICEYETTCVSAVGPIKAFFESAYEGVSFTSLIHESYMEWSSTQFVREDTFASGVALFLRALNSNALLYGPYVEEEQAVVVAHSPLIGASSLEPSVGPTITEENSNSGSLYSPEGSFPHSPSSTGLGSVPSLPLMLYACIQMSAAFREGTPYHRCSSPEEDEWLMVYRARVLEWVGFNVLNIVPHTYTVFLCATPLKESLLCPRVIESTLNFISDIQCNLDLMVDEASAPCVVAAASMLLATRMHLSVSLEELLGVVHSRWPTRYASFFERVIEFFPSSTTNCT